MKFFHKNQQIKQNDSVDIVIQDNETLETKIELENNSRNTISDVSLDTEIPLDYQIPSGLRPDEISFIKLTLDGATLWKKANEVLEKGGKPIQDPAIIIKWRESAKLGKW